MKRLVLLLGLAVLGWLGRRQLRSYGDAQRYLTLLALLQIVAVMGKTASSAKAQSVESRLNTKVLPALGTLNSAVAPIAGNSSFLGGLSAISGSLLLAGGDTDASLGHITGTVTTGNINTMIDRINGLLSWTFAMASDHNQVLSALSASGYI